MDGAQCADTPGVQDFPWPVRIPMRFSDAAMCSSLQRPAMRRIAANASSEVRQPCSPVRRFLTRSSECWPPFQWITRTTSRAAWSTSATMPVIKARTAADGCACSCRARSRRLLYLLRRFVLLSTSKRP